MAGIWFDHARYDGFGNLYNKTGTGGAPSWSGTIDAATNRLSGLSYDANGNQTFAPMTAGMPDAFNMTYDAANRMVYSENPTQSRTSEYHYDAGNKRVYEKRFDGGTQEWVYFFGVTGQRLARYTFTVSGSAITFTQDTASVWFGGKLVQKVNSLASTYAYEDRLGSVGKYLPYGEDKPGATNPANDNEKFATYTRDANTGIDYADQRWHAQGTGRFLTADPYQASAGPGDPGSWNRYGYVQGDPVGYRDRKGLLRTSTQLDNFDFCRDFPGFCPNEEGGGGGDGAGNGEDAPEQVGGGSDDQDTSVDGLIRASKKRLVDRIDDPCAEALGFKDSADAFAQLDKVKIRTARLGLPTYNTKNGKMEAVGGPFARTNPLTGTIGINENINWNDLQHQRVVIDGNEDVRDVLTGEMNRLGAKEMWGMQLFDLVMLHELAHTKVIGGKNPDKLANEKEIWKTCIRW